MDNDTCGDCGAAVHPFMVKDELWPIRPDGLLCIPCFEKRLGRSLRIDDLSDASINAWMRWEKERLVLVDAESAWAILRITIDRFGYDITHENCVTAVSEMMS